MPMGSKQGRIHIVYKNCYNHTGICIAPQKVTMVYFRRK